MSSLSIFADELDLWGIQGFSIQMLYGILVDSSRYYRSFEIPKRRGGSRKIYAPYPILAQIQQKILSVLQDRLNVSDQAYAYCRGKNAVMHASAHLGCDELLTVDIEGFFENTTRRSVYGALLASNFEKTFAHLVSVIVTLHDSLPQGAPTSPMLSNAVFRPIDFRLLRLADHLQIKYSRYADDLAFSGKHVPRNLSRSIDGIIFEYNYKLNSEKTMLKVKGARKVITGVSISSGVLKVPREFARSTRAAVHGLESNIGNLSSMHALDPLVFERVVGKLNYWLQIEPKNNYVLRKKKILSEAHQNFLGLSAEFKLEEYI